MAACAVWPAAQGAAAVAHATAQRPPVYLRPVSKRNAACRLHCSAAAAQPDGAAAAPAAAAVFSELAAEVLRDAPSVEARPCGGQAGNGLFLTEAAAQGDAVLRVPLAACLVVDYRSEPGLQLPRGQWPRLTRGVQKDAALPWDVLQALALLDALAGGADPFWERYANAVLPQPAELTLPLCFPPQLLPELQHGAIEAGARAQQERLAALFPGLSAAMCEGGPSWLQWGFACVRSRAFRLREDCFAFVPFLDLANHAADPSCDFRLSADGRAVELVALRALAAGQEATISYTGAEGLTNQRLMAQYGFVPTGGNPADRLQLAALRGGASSSDSDGSSGGGSSSDSDSNSSGGSSGGGRDESAQQPVLLSLDRMQASMRDGERMAAALSGRDAYAYAALKSLPFAAEEEGASPLGQQLELAQRLVAELEAEAAAWPTTLEQDSQLAVQRREAAAAAAAGGGGGWDARLSAALDYRLQRKALVTSARLLLRDFVAGGGGS